MTSRAGLRPRTVQDLIDQLFQVATEQRDNPLVIQVETTVTRVLLANPGRVAFTLTNLGASNVFLWSDPQVSSTRGLWAQPNGGSVTLIYDEDFSRTGYAWFAIADPAASAIAIQEVLIGAT